MTTLNATTHSHSMIDLFFPASAGSVGEAQSRAAEKGLDGLVYVAHSPDELPEAGEWSTEPGQPLILLACSVVGSGYRMAVLVEDWESANFDILEATDDLNLVVAAVAEMGGTAYAVCPHQSADGEVSRQAARLAEASAAGVVTIVAGGSLMARDLDIEQAAAAQRRILGATGPFGELDNVGRYATLLATETLDCGNVISSLNAGFGVAVEIGDHRNKPNAGQQGGNGEPKKRRRRRRRGGKREGGDGGQRGG